MATYKKNYLSSVVLRIDFDPVELGQLSDFLKSIESEFPIVEQKEGQEGSFFLDMKTGVAQQAHNKRVYWQVFNKDKSKIVEIDNKYIYIEYRKYKNSKVLLDDIETVFVKFIEKFKVHTARRVGLRYINKIEFPKDKKYFDWKGYISKALISDLDFVVKGKHAVSRVLGQMIIRKEDANITFNYGIVNDDFPNEIVKKQFILDFDCVSKFPVDLSDTDINAFVKSCNKYVEDLFESSIGDSLRQKMQR